MIEIIKTATVETEARVVIKQVTGTRIEWFVISSRGPHTDCVTSLKAKTRRAALAALTAPVITRRLLGV